MVVLLVTLGIAASLLAYAISPTRQARGRPRRPQRRPRARPRQGRAQSDSTKPVKKPGARTRPSRSAARRRRWTEGRATRTAALMAQCGRGGCVRRPRMTIVIRPRRGHMDCAPRQPAQAAGGVACGHGRHGGADRAERRRAGCPRAARAAALPPGPRAPAIAADARVGARPDMADATLRVAAGGDVHADVRSERRSQW